MGVLRYVPRICKQSENHRQEKHKGKRLQNEAQSLGQSRETEAKKETIAGTKRLLIEEDIYRRLRKDEGEEPFRARRRSEPR